MLCFAIGPDTDIYFRFLVCRFMTFVVYCTQYPLYLSGTFFFKFGYFKETKNGIDTENTDGFLKRNGLFHIRMNFRMSLF